MKVRVRVKVGVRVTLRVPVSRGQLKPVTAGVRGVSGAVCVCVCVCACVWLARYTKNLPRG